MQDNLEGGCACGAVRYGLNAQPLSLYACHCKRCQSYACAYTLSMPVRRVDVELSGAEPVEHNAPTDSGRMARIFFCGICHTRVWHAPALPELLTVMAGTLDDTSWVAPVAHIWTKHKQPGSHIDADTLSFEGQPPARELLFQAWNKAID